MTELVGMKRRLDAAQKLKLAKFAYEKFIDPKLRAKETKARQALIDAIVLSAERIPLPELAVLRRHRMLHTFDTIALPYSLNCTTGRKTFEVGDKTVERDEKVRIWQPREWEAFVPSNIANAIHAAGHHSPFEGKMVGNLRLPKPIEVPCLAHRFTPQCALGIEEKSNDGEVNFSGGTMMTPKIAGALEAYYVAARERIVAEVKLAQAACRLIAASTHYSQILGFWPEAKEIETDLFDERLPKAVSLVTISDEDKQALCKNLKARGVKGSDICRAA